MNDRQLHNTVFSGLCWVGVVNMGAGVLLAIWNSGLFGAVHRWFVSVPVAGQLFVVGFVMFVVGFVMLVLSVILGAITELSHSNPDPTYNPDGDH